MPTKKPMPTAEELSRWISPRDALDLVAKAMDGKKSVAESAIVERLRGGIIVACALKMAFSVDRNDPTKDINTAIPANYWNFWGRNADHLNMWITNSVRFYLGTVNSIGDEVSFSYFDIRFRPEDIYEMIPTPREAPKGPASSPEKPTVKPKGTLVSDADLRLWHALYAKVYGGSPAATLDHAWASAQGMFPDKSVGRDRVRELRAGGKTGPKKAMPDT